MPVPAVSWNPLARFLSPDFMPHGFCYLWDPTIVWLHVISDALIAISYYCIPAALIYFAYKNRDLPFHRIFWMFGTFILACGTSHFMEVWNVWHSSYLVSGVIKAVTAIVSVITAVVIVPLVPKAISWPNRLQAEEALRKSQNQLAGVIASAMDAIVSIDEQQRVVMFNAAAERMFGCKTAEALGGHIDRFIPERFRDLHAGHIHNFGDTSVTNRKMGALGALRALRGDGTEFPVEASISQLGESGRKLFTVIMRDVTEKHRAEMNRLRLASIVESTDSAVLSKDLSGVVTSWNRGAQQLYGYSAEEMVGKHISTIIPTHLKDEEQEFLRQVAQGKLVRQDETVRRRKDGSFIYVSLILSPILDANGQILGASTIAHDISQRKQAEQHLKESEERLRIFIEHAPAALAMFDREMRYLQVSRRWRTDYGLGQDDLIGVSHYDLFPKLAERWKKIFRRGLAGEIVQEESDRFERADGTVQWIRWEMRPWHEANGKIGGIVLFSEDMTAAKEAEEALRTSHARLKKVLEVETVGVLFWDLTTGALTDANDTFLDLMGYSRREVEACELTWQRLTPPEYMEVSRAEVKKFLASGRVGPYEKEYFHKDGTRQWFIFAGSSLGNNTCVEFCVDISDRKKAEAALRESEERLRIFIEHAPAALAMFDRKMRYVQVSRRWRADYSLGERDLIGASHYDLFPNLPERWKEIHRRGLAGEILREESDRFERTDGSVQWIRWEIRPWHEATGEIGGLVIFAEDISESHRSQEQLAGQAEELARQAEELLRSADEMRRLNQELEQRVLERTAQLEAANKELEAFTYSVSHDLRAPLRHIAGFSGILLEEFSPALPAQAQQYLQRIQDGARRMGLLVDELLTLARIGRQSLQTQTTELNLMVEEVRAMLSHETNGRQIEWRIDTLPSVECDPVLIKQVFQNLLSNAIKYSRNRPDSVIEVGTGEQDGKSVIFVRDNGVGFSMKYADKLFGVFQRLHRSEDFEGTGVGLATVQRIIRKHGGNIWAEAGLNKGATFYFTLAGLAPEHPRHETQAAGA